MQACRFAIIAAIMCTLVPHAAAQFILRESAAERGILPYQQAFGKGGTAAVADFDNDGDLDMFFPTTLGQRDQLYVNQGNGQFVENAVALGVASIANNRVALFVDVDGDSRLDLIVARDFNQTPAAIATGSQILLYMQTEQGTFVDATAGSGLEAVVLAETATSHLGGMAAGDLNGDGLPDLVATVWFGHIAVLLNNGDGTFTDISSLSTLGVNYTRAYEPFIYDFNGDKRLDIFIAVDALPNVLYINNGDNTFTDVAPQAGINSTWNDMGVAPGDFDNDGDLDIYTTVISGPTRHNLLFQNNSDESTIQFDEIATEAGVTEGGWAWGTTFADLDLDTRLDLLVTNGFSSSIDKSIAYLQVPGFTFVDQAALMLFDDLLWGSALVAADIDRDGDLDTVQTCAADGPIRICENTIDHEQADRNWLAVRVRDGTANTRGLGAVVRVETATANMMRVISAGMSYMGQEPAEAHFGLGPNTTVLAVQIEWPEGQQTRVENIASNQIITMTRFGVVGDSPCDLDLSGDVDSTDFFDFFSRFFEQNADYDSNGITNSNDMFGFLNCFFGA